MPKISVIVPVYKVEELLGRCVDSILNQSFSDFELILVDDGSPDRSGSICDEYARKDSRVRVIHKENGGLSSARNAGIEIALGDYFSFVDSDDMIHPELLRFLYNALLKHDADIASTRYISFREFKPDIVPLYNVEEKLLLSGDFLDSLYPTHFEQIGVSAWGKLYKSELFRKLRYPNGKIYEDLHIYLKLLQLCRRIVVVSEPMYYYYTGNISITKSSYLTHCRFDEFLVREKHIAYFSQRGNTEQAQYAQNDYLTFFLRNAFAVLTTYREKKKDFIPHMRDAGKMIPSMIRNPHICTMRKLCLLMLWLSPRLSKEIARKTIPDCLLEEML